MGVPEHPATVEQVNATAKRSASSRDIYRPSRSERPTLVARSAIGDVLARGGRLQIARLRVRFPPPPAATVDLSSCIRNKDCGSTEKRPLDAELEPGAPHRIGQADTNCQR